MIEVSIIIPARNAVRTLAETIDSIRAQTSPSWEVIVVENGSTDGTAELAEKIAASERRVRVVRSDARSVGGARNVGIRTARYDWLLFLDADDRVLPEFLAKLGRALRKDPSLDAVYCGYERRTEGGISSSRHLEPWSENLFAVAARYCAWVVHSVVIRRRSAEEVGGFPEDLSTCEDWLFWQRVLRGGARFGCVPEYLAIYRVRPESASMDGSRMAADMLRVIRIGHGPDGAVPHPAAAYANGASPDREPADRLQALTWAAALMIGRGEDGSRVLDLVPHDRDPEFDPAVLAYAVSNGAPLPQSLPGSGWKELWPEIEGRVLRLFDAYEKQTGAPGLARRALHLLAGALVGEAGAGEPTTIGDTAILALDAADPIPDLSFPPAAERFLCRVSLQGDFLGFVGLPISGGSVAGAVLADAIAGEHAWAILERYWDLAAARGLRWGPLFLLSLGRRWARAIARFFGKRGPDFEAWALATLGRASLLRELLGAGGPREGIRAARGSPLRIDLCGRIPAVDTGGAVRDCLLAFAGVPIGMLGLPPAKRPLSARTLRRAALLASGHEICVLAAREGIVGRSLLEPTPLGKRLRQARASRPEPGRNEEGASALGQDRKDAERALLLARRNPFLIGTSASRRAAFPAECAADLLAGARAHGEATFGPTSAPLGAIFYAPELVKPNGSDERGTRAPRLPSPAPARERAAATLLRVAQRAFPSSRTHLGRLAVADRLPILLYHRIAEDGPSGLARHRVSPAALEEQMGFLREHHFYTIGLEDWREACARRRPLRGRPVLLTFDDGTRDFRERAWPLLRAFEFTAVVFLPAGFLGGRAEWDAPYGDPAPILSVEEIRELQEAGVAFGSHACSHAPLSGLSPADIVREAARSRSALREVLGRPADAIAYPYGDHDPIVRHLVGASGYTYGLTAAGQAAKFSDPLLALPRLSVGGNTTPIEFARLVLPKGKDRNR